MTDVSADVTTDASVVDGTYRGHFDRVEDVDWIAVDLTAGVTYTIRALGSDSDNGTAQYVGIQDIYDSNSASVDHEWADYFQIRQASEGYFTTEGQTEFTPTESGTYYIAVNSWGIDIGSYTVYVTEDQIGTGDTDDRFVGGDGNNWIQGGCGDDTIIGGESADFLDGEWGDDRLTGGAGADVFTFWSDNWDDIRDFVADLWGNDTITDFDPAEDQLHFAGRIIRGLQDLTITEENGNTIITAEWGDSVTLLGVSADELTDDNFEFRLGVRLNGGNIEGQDGDDSLVGTAADDTIYGMEGDDTIIAGDGENYLRGFEGNDFIIGGSSIDIIGGEEGDDTIRAGAGDDFIVSNEGDDSVAGQDGNDLIETHIGNDTLRGGSGDDTLRPGRGDDVMSGGAGEDIFVIGRLWGNDTITDFDMAEDFLDFRGSGLDIADLTIAADGNNTIISNGDNSLTLIGVDSEEFVAAASDLIWEPGSVTSHYSEYGRVEEAGDATEEDILVQTSVLVDEAGHWAADEDGVTRTSYSFLNYDSVAVSDDNSTWWFDAIEPVTPLTQYAVEQLILEIESYTNLDLVWVEDYQESGGNIRLGYHEFVIGGASSAPYEGPYSAEVFNGIHVGEEFLYGYYAHELGHSLGFDDLPDWNEWTGNDYTVMSYIRSARHPDAEFTSVPTNGYMYADIAGLQYLYGVDEESTAGNETYAYDVAEPLLKTLWDYGGNDTISVYGVGDAVHINLTPGTWSNIGPDIRYDGGGEVVAVETGTLFIMPDTIIENAIGGDGADTLTGNGADNLLKGGDGADTLLGAEGSDTLVGGDGADMLTGGDGADMFRMSAGGTVSQTNDGSCGDSVQVTDIVTDFEDGVDLIGFAENETVGFADITITQMGDDVMVEDSKGNSLLIRNMNAADITIADFEGNTVGVALVGTDTAESLVGGDMDDTLSGGRGTDSLDGGAGDDVLFGGTQADRLDGGEGNDSLLGGNGNDTVEGGSGSDTLSGSIGDDSLSGGGQGDRLFGDTGADTLNGGGGSDRVDYLIDTADILVDLETGEATGGFADGDVLISIESLFGGKGDDTLRALETGSRLNGAGGDDIVTGRSGDDLLAGGNGNDVVTGGAGNDLMNGNRGDDTLNGSAGDDTLRGSNGADTFVFTAGGGDDIILDFRANDLLDLSATTTDFASLADVQSAATVTESGLLIDLGGGDSVLLIGLTLNDLDTLQLSL
ncbi:MAG: M10 family metallopeptidase C-terminal domain-containing protein [Kordiimonadaceae bacterium]|nr:M10 family metallopeptidase C-terminal domain-containing protein [Kordiimonadaceae bacterium]MBO6570438.1 M10 family metallopeptidase C-terminal domain-containing protein [Kordiimonadaceae bacterium]